MDKQEIEKLAQLARIELSEKEKEDLLKDIEGILAFVDQVQEVTVDMRAEERVGVPYNVMREDGEPHKSGVYSDVLLGAAPNTEKGYIKVKKIL